MNVKFVVQGSPVGKGRHKYRKHQNYVQTYTPEKTVNYEDLVKMEYRRQVKYYFPDNHAVYMYIRAYYKIPSNASRKKREEMLSGNCVPLVKPDSDNIAKIIMDALNGIAYKDDNQVAVSVEKFYSETPHVEIWMFSDRKDLLNEICKGENL